MPIGFESGLSILPNSNGNDSSQSNLRQFTQFCREHEPSIFTYILRMVGSREDAEDLTQEALLQAYRTWNQVDPELAGGYVKWCYRIAHNLAIDLLRKKKPRYADDEEMERAADDKSPRPEEVYEHRVRADQVREALGELDEKYREVLILRLQEDMSYEKIAEILEVPVSTVETRIFRAKAMLRQKLEKRK
jgi:RNA polymerase sigma-70 factor (ECF subfamily)